MQDYGAGIYGKALYGKYTVKECAAAPVSTSTVLGTIGRRLMSFLAQAFSASAVQAAASFTIFYGPVTEESSTWSDDAEEADIWAPVTEAPSIWTDTPSYG